MSDILTEEFASGDPSVAPASYTLDAEVFYVGSVAALSFGFELAITCFPASRHIVHLLDVNRVVSRAHHKPM